MPPLSNCWWTEAKEQFSGIQPHESSSQIIHACDPQKRFILSRCLARIFSMLREFYICTRINKCATWWCIVCAWFCRLDPQQQTTSISRTVRSGVKFVQTLWRKSVDTAILMHHTHTKSTRRRFSTFYCILASPRLPSQRFVLGERVWEGGILPFWWNQAEHL